MTSMDPWFLYQMKQITDEIKAIAASEAQANTSPRSSLRKAKRMGVSDERC